MKGTRLKRAKQKLAWGEAIDPVTGDKLTFGERISWFIQRNIIRRWWFFLFITLTTIIIWTLNIAVGLLWWNLAASYLAIAIEFLVGMAMMNQTKRDATVIREIRAMSEHMEKLEETALKRIAAIEARLEHTDK